MQLLKDIIAGFAGESAAGIVDLLHKKKNVNEFLIAKKLKLTINQTRNILYKLADEGLVSFVRKKDSKKGGWYTYFWTLNSGKSLIKFRDKLEEEIFRLKEQLEKRKNKTFYYSSGADLEYTEEEALLHDYICPETGEVLEVRESGEIVNRLQKEIDRLNALIQEVGIEIGEVEKREGRARARRIKKEEDKKKDERLKKKRKREREARKLKVKSAKKSGGKIKAKGVRKISRRRAVRRGVKKKAKK